MGPLQAGMQNIQVSLPNVQTNPSWNESSSSARRILYLNETEFHRLELKSCKVPLRRALLTTLLRLRWKLGHLPACGGTQERACRARVLLPGLSSSVIPCMERLRGLQTQKYHGNIRLVKQVILHEIRCISLSVVRPKPWLDKKPLKTIKEATC